MSIKVTKGEFNQALKKLAHDFKIMGPVAEYRGGRFSNDDNLTYKEISAIEDAVWDRKAHFSCKEVIYPVTQCLFNFKGNDFTIADNDTKPILIFLRACDIHAVNRLDCMFLESGNNKDFYYKKRRSKIKFVLIECSESFENCFCVSMGTNSTDNYEAAIRINKDDICLQIRDKDLETYFKQDGTETDFFPEFVQSNPSTVRTPDQICDDYKKIRSILTNHEMWKQYETRCIGCGRCTTSCPTCSCYSVFDLQYDENSNFGERRRQHSSCMIDKFSDMAGGHGFRDTYDKRLRYRGLHKVNDFKSRNGKNHMCVGCGRCDDRCPQYISFINVINKMTEIVEEKVNKEV